ncbi:Hypothetical protein A7982_02305 [Minicystis rosea]|nr:Hypothetical protein A7982_02305 [Minicystis rosea]
MRPRRRVRLRRTERRIERRAPLRSARRFVWSGLASGHPMKSITVREVMF